MSSGFLNYPYPGTSSGYDSDAARAWAAAQAAAAQAGGLSSLHTTALGKKKIHSQVFHFIHYILYKNFDKRKTYKH